MTVGLPNKSYCIVVIGRYTDTDIVILKNTDIDNDVASVFKTPKIPKYRSNWSRTIEHRRNVWLLLALQVVLWFSFQFSAFVCTCTLDWILKSVQSISQHSLISCQCHWCADCGLLNNFDPRNDSRSFEHINMCSDADRRADPVPVDYFSLYTCAIVKCNKLLLTYLLFSLSDI